MNYIFERGKFTEDELESAIIELFQLEGYSYVHGDSIHRKFDEILLYEDLENYLSNRYSLEDLTENEIQTIINKINLINETPLYLGNREVYRLIMDGFNLEREDHSKTALHIDYIDYDNVDGNIFKVINQYTVEDIANRRPDLLVFINGIPLGICEFKTAIEEDKTIHDAWEQVTIRYNRDIPSLTKYCLMSLISDGANTRLGTIFTPYEYYYAWNKANDDEKVSNGISSLFTMIKGAFAKDRILAILRDFIFYPDDSDDEEAIICRYPQFFAANKLLNNIKQHLKPFGDGKGGTYFGATGCGKTFTMLFLSRMMMQRDNETFKNPTIVILTDREDLDTQTSELFVTAKKYLGDEEVRSIESREDLDETLRNKASGGVYIITIQKFCDSTGLLSDRSNIICISDEAHRTQTSIGSKLKKTDEGVFTTYGFAHYLREGFPNATYVGFTGTPIDETISVFGDVVDSYTMKESSDDGITVTITYEPRLARVIVSDEQAKEIEKYYRQCAERGSTEEQIEASKKAMSKMSVILGEPGRLKKLAKDIVEHYEALCSQKPDVVQKAMIVCNDRVLAYKVLKEILSIREDWGVSKKTEDESKLTKEELDKLVALPKINLVATRGENDDPDLYNACGTKNYRKTLDKQFKNNDSNFKIAIVVDMWITGFDVPSLAVMYIDKPLQKHTLIQTISRVNRVFVGKDKGLVVDYIGIKEDMDKAVKIFGRPTDSPIEELKITLGVFRNHLAKIDDLLVDFSANKFFVGTPLERLNCLNDATEFVQRKNEIQTQFMGLSRILKSAYQICYPSGELTDYEVNKAQFYMAIRSIIFKQTKGDAPDTETMNIVVEQMIHDAIACTGVESVVNQNRTEDIFSEEYVEKLKSVNMPITRFNALLKLLKRAIKAYGKTNKVKAREFDEMLKQIVDEYNNRDKLVFTSEVVADFVDDLSDQVINILRNLEEDKKSFEKMGITFEEKAFYDILVKVRDDHGFPYEDDKCIILAKSIKELVDDKAQFADWSTRDDVKNQLNMELTVLLYNNGYPPQWDEEVFEKVMEQAENFKEYCNA